eukprot:SAG22_NODE_7645_length_720_cov_0.675241_1_plen_33_part_10
MQLRAASMQRVALTLSCRLALSYSLVLYCLAYS